MLHLPLLLYTLPCKVERASSIFRVQMIQNVHQVLATTPRRIIIEQIQLGDALTEEVPQHYPCFLILTDSNRFVYRPLHLELAAVDTDLYWYHGDTNNSPWHRNTYYQ